MSYDYNHDGETNWEDIVYDMDMEEIENGTYISHGYDYDEEGSDDEWHENMTYSSYSYSSSSNSTSDGPGCLATLLACFLTVCPTMFIYNIIDKYIDMSDNASVIILFAIAIVVTIVWMAILS